MGGARQVTAEELFRMPDDGWRRELIAGELRTAPPTGFEQGTVIATLGGLLSAFIRQHKLGVVAVGQPGFVLARDPDTVRAPDVAFIRKERLATNPVGPTFWTGAPDLAVEVISPSDTVHAVDEKAKAWLAAGVEAVWVVNPAWRTVTVYRSATDIKTLTEDDELEGQSVLPGFRCRVADIFLTE
ncbi:MAG: Uma2 family endonuclease [Planctomycetes bacterium]|nr:Uma2 family endonuclease [Planctomycetota bacterium]